MQPAIGKLIRQLCPELCPRCRQESSAGFCDACRDEFARIESPCPLCGMPAHSHVCAGGDPAWRIDAVRAPLCYQPPLAGYIQALKYQRQRLLGRVLGELLAGGIGAGTDAIDAIVSVPLHRRRLRQRRFNQADEVAIALGHRLAIPLASDAVRRLTDTRPQTDLGRTARRRNPDKAFRASQRLNGLRIAIVDDVITTGATVNALASALKEAGAIRVEAWGVARSIGDEAGRDQPERKM
jgi:ComF family protein